MDGRKCWMKRIRTKELKMLSEKRKDGKRGDGRQVLKSKDIGGELKCWQGSRTTVSLPERPGLMDDRY